MDLKYVIFDYGGTLDTGGVHWADMIFRAYKEHGLDVAAEDFRKAYIAVERHLGGSRVVLPSHTFHETLSLKIRLQQRWLYEHGCVEQGIAELETQHKAVVGELYQQAKRNTCLARSVMMALRTAGLRMALVSNFYGNIRTVLREMGLDDLFEHVIESAEVGIRKPDPRIFALAADRLAVPNADRSRVAVVGDSLEKDIVPAGSLGFRTVWISPVTVGAVSVFDDRTACAAGNAPTCRISSLSQLLLYVDNMVEGQAPAPEKWV